MTPPRGIERYPDMEVCPWCGGFFDQLEEYTGWCGACTSMYLGMETSWCGTCSTWKPVTFFTHNRNGKLRSSCRACETAMKREWRAKNAERSRQIDRTSQQRRRALADTG